MKTKHCKDCSREYPATAEFFGLADKERGYLRSYCWDCQRERSRAVNESRKVARRQNPKIRKKMSEVDRQRKYERYLKKWNEWSTARREEARRKIDEYKMANGCADCGWNDIAGALEFDHLPGTNKKFDISQKLTSSWDILENEIAKCEVVCVRCHRLRTLKRLRPNT